MNEARTSFSRILLGLAYVLPVIVPLLLLVDPAAGFSPDWNNHLWIIGYYGEYFRQHGEMPTVINLAPAVGIALPVFYGYLLYPVLGLFSTMLGSALALRLGILLLVAGQFYSVFYAGRIVLKHRGVAYVASCSLAWATYALTNLYNRGAIPEYFATGFLVIAIALGSAALAEGGLDRRRFLAWLSVMSVLLAVGSHPPTAVLAFALLLLLGGCAVMGGLKGERGIFRGMWAHLLAGAGVGAVLLAPWIYASWRFVGQLPVGTAYESLVFYLDRCDSFWGRFAPFPLDLLSMKNGVAHLFTPYLEAPIDVILVLLLGWNLEICRRLRVRTSSGVASPAGKTLEIVLVASIAWFVLLAAISVSPMLAGAFRFFAPYIQFAYRLVSHCNIALLIGVFASGALVAKRDGYRRYRRQTQVVLAVCLVAAGEGLWIKLYHAEVVAAPIDAPQYLPGGDRAALTTKGQAELAFAYNTAGSTAELGDAELSKATVVVFPVGHGDADFGQIGGAKVELASPGWVFTNVVIYPWLEITIDGRTLSRESTARWRPLLAIQLPAGAHQLQLVWRPERTWLILHSLSRWMFVGLTIATFFWAVLRLFSGRAGNSRDGVANVMDPGTI